MTIAAAARPSQTSPPADASRVESADRDLADKPRSFSLAEAARRFLPPGPNGNPQQVATLGRWITKGVKLRKGGRHYLAVSRSPGRWLVTREATEQFLAVLAADRAGAAPPASPAEDDADRSAHEAAERDLDAAGIGA